MATVETEADREAIAAANAIPDEEKSIEEMADEPVEPAPVPPMQVPLPGMTETISASFGGSKPTVSEIRLMGGKMPIDGSFQKGDEFDVMVRVKVTGVLGQDVTDDWGKVTRTVRRHFARLLSVRRVN